MRALDRTTASWSDVGVSSLFTLLTDRRSTLPSIGSFSQRTSSCSHDMPCSDLSRDLCTRSRRGLLSGRCTSTHTIWDRLGNIALLNAKVLSELHPYAEGGHAFGLRPTAF